jgi:integrase
MSIYARKDSPFYHFDFWFKGTRFSGPTGCTTKREAEAFERAEREQARHQAKIKPEPLSTRLNDIADRYWKDIGQHHVGSDTTFRDLDRLVCYFGADKTLHDITDIDVADLVAWRRGHKVTSHRKKPIKDASKSSAGLGIGVAGDTQLAKPRLIAPATVNRSTTEVLKKLFTYAKSLGVRFDAEPKWRKRLLKEPEERVRVLHDDEAERLEAATRDDYLPIMDFAGASGLRLAECLLRWSEVNFGARQIQKKGKGDKNITVPITPTLRAILWPLKGHHDEFVFTYIAKRTRKAEKLVRGQRYPITYNGLKTAWRRLRATAGVSNFRFHDLRHDFATKLLRDSGNLKMVQKALNHASIKTTVRYAHVLNDDLADALQRVQKSRVKSRRGAKKAS